MDFGDTEGEALANGAMFRDVTTRENTDDLLSRVDLGPAIEMALAKLPEPFQSTVVLVDNQGFLDMAVYVMRSSERVRLGMATGNSKSNFRVPAGIVSGLTPLRFIADPIGGSRASVSEEITVAPGDTVGLTIPPI